MDGQMNTHRRCGDCQLCCKLLPVRELSKGASERCRHQRVGKGCTVYRQPGMPDNVCWVGWFGVRPRFRREGFGTNAMYALFDVAQNIGCQELWVYTGSSDDVAVSFYKSLGFEVLGSAAEWVPGRTMDDSDIVLRRML